MRKLTLTAYPPRFAAAPSRWGYWVAGRGCYVIAETPGMLGRIQPGALHTRHSEME